jgi:hypothetical protein
MHKLATLRLSAPTVNAPAESDALSDQLTHVLDTLGGASTRLRAEVKEARKALAQAKRQNATERKSLATSLEGDAYLNESKRVEGRYATQLAAAAVLDPAPVEAVEEECIETLVATGAAGLRLYAVGQELNVLRVQRAAATCTHPPQPQPHAGGATATATARWCGVAAAAL